MISTVSIIGIDDSVSPKDIADLSLKYPFVEWGINLSPNRIGIGFPTQKFINEVIEISENIRLLGVLHDKWLEDFNHGKISIQTERPDIWKSIGRVQVSVKKASEKIIESISLIQGKQIILRVDSLKEYIKLTTKNRNATPLIIGDVTSYPAGYELSCLEDVKGFVAMTYVGNYWMSINDIPRNELSPHSFNIIETEKILDFIEDYVDEALWYNAVIETPIVKKRISQRP